MFEMESKKDEVPKCILLANSHIDVAWLWPKKETREVIAETFSSAVRLIEKYNITYAQSNAIYFLWLANDNSALLDKIREWASKRLWELVGGSLVEFDANMPLGESLVRQFLYGQEIFRNIFSDQAEICWLPDTFGFPISLPKILRHVGIKYFFTTKITWNDTTQFPYNIFRWISDDGSFVYAYITPGSYEGKLRKDRCSRWIHKWRQKEIPPKILVLYGKGDHGGGPTEEDAEVAKILVRKGSAEIGLAIDFFRNIENIDLPSWNDELYLEFHRGVYTTQSTLKKIIRACETILLDIDTLQAFLFIKNGEYYDPDSIKELWITLLTNHFHDIMASSLSYDATVESLQELLDCYRKAKKIRRELTKKLIKDMQGILIINTLPWRRNIIVRIDNKEKIARDVPPFSVVSLKKESLSTGEVIAKESRNHIILENSQLIVKISKKSGWVTSIYSKTTGKELLREPIRIRIYDDAPTLKRRTLGGIPAIIFDAWEVFIFDKKPKWWDIKLKNVCVSYKSEARVIAKANVGVRFLPWDQAKIEVEYELRSFESYLQIKVKVDSKLKHKLVKLVVPFNTNIDRAIYGAPYGSVERRDYDSPNADSRTKAKYEVPTAGWVAIRDENSLFYMVTRNNFGVSKSSRALEVSILRTPMFPSKRMLEIPPRILSSLLYAMLRGTAPARNLVIKIMTFFSKAAAKYMDQGSKESLIRIGYTNKNKISEVIRIWRDMIHEPIIIINGKARTDRTINMISTNESVAVHLKLSERRDGIIMRIWNPNDNQEEIMIPSNFSIIHVNGLEEPIRSKVNDTGEIRLKPKELLAIKITKNQP